MKTETDKIVIENKILMRNMQACESKLLQNKEQINRLMREFAEKNETYGNKVKELNRENLTLDKECTKLRSEVKKINISIEEHERRKSKVKDLESQIVDLKCRLLGGGEERPKGEVNVEIFSQEKLNEILSGNTELFSLYTIIDAVKTGKGLSFPNKNKNILNINDSASSEQEASALLEEIKSGFFTEKENFIQTKKLLSLYIEYLNQTISSTHDNKEVIRLTEELNFYKKELSKREMHFKYYKEKIKQCKFDLKEKIIRFKKIKIKEGFSKAIIQMKELSIISGIETSKYSNWFANFSKYIFLFIIANSSYFVINLFVKIDNVGISLLISSFVILTLFITMLYNLLLVKISYQDKKEKYLEKIAMLEIMSDLDHINAFIKLEKFVEKFDENVTSRK